MGKSYKKRYTAIKKYDEHSDQATQGNDHHELSRGKKKQTQNGPYDLTVDVGENIDI